MKKNYPVTQKEVPVSASANILSTTDTKGRITYVNQDFLEISGFEEEELIGKAHNVVRHPDMPPAAFEDLWRTIQSGRSWMGIVKNRCKNGDHYWVNAYVTPVFKDGQIVEYQSVRSQATREQIARAEKLYAALNAGKPPLAFRFHGFRFSQKVLVTFVLVILATLAVPVAFGNLDWKLLLASALLPWAVIGPFLWREVKPLCKVIAQSSARFDSAVARYVFSGRTDEVGQLLLNNLYLEKETGGVVGRIADSAQDISAHAHALQETITVSMDAASQENEALAELSGAIGILKTAIAEVSQIANQTADTTEDAQAETERSRKVIEDTMQAIQALVQEIQQASSVIENLNAQSDKISTVVNVISSIAEQTNLLALNAAIEAARAGEHGRGFAVVADEVRTLANRTHDSTEEIQGMIEELLAGTSQAVRVMEQSQQQVSASVEHGQKAVASLDSITRAVQRISQMSQQTAEAVDTQNESVNEINESVDEIREASTENVAALKANQQASEAMSENAEKLKALAGQFWAKQSRNA